MAQAGGIVLVPGGLQGFQKPGIKLFDPFAES
jgi:hypothetical protein